MNKELLITFEEYQNKLPIKAPYTYVISNDTQKLYYFGSRHSYDPSDPEFPKLKEYFYDFVETTAGQDRVVLVEGGDWPVMKNEREAILECSEMGYMAYFAHKERIERYSPEPSRQLKFDELSKKFTRNEIVYYYFALQCWQWERKNKTSGFEGYIKSSLEGYRNIHGWEDFDFSLDHLKEIHKEFFGVDFDITDTKFFRDITNPTKTISNINAVSRFEDEGFRDLYILSEIEKNWNMGKSIFIIYGKTHAEIQEPVLRTLV